MADEGIQQIQVPVVWVGLEEMPITTVSNFVVQVAAPDELILTIGQVAPPIIVGTVEEQVTQAQAIRFIQARPLFRGGMTTHRARELIKVLQDTLDNHEKLPKQPPSGGGTP